MGEHKLTINVILNNKTVYAPYTPKQTTAEDACIYLCKHLEIGTVARHLFALRSSKQVYLMPAETFEANACNYDFRIRYKIPKIIRLKKIDAKAYEYYFHQARVDIIENKVMGIDFETSRKQLLGLGISDMYRVMLEKQLSQQALINDYKKYIPKEVLSRHSIFVKKPIKEALSRLGKQQHTGLNASYVMDAYLREFESMADEYPLEEFKADIEQSGVITKILIRVSPFYATDPGIRYCSDSNKQKWELICSIEDVCVISIREDSSMEISRRTGVPFYLQFDSIMKMRSFVSLVDGYYRLSVKWTFNICQEVVTPSLQKLYAMKCHGPVGGEFSYAKLEEKRFNRRGCFILRESELKYDVCFIDVSLGENHKPKTYKLERLSNDEFVFNDDMTRYKNLGQLMHAYNDPSREIFLGECLPPSEYDNSPLLLCKNVVNSGDILAETEENLTLSNPICINTYDLQHYAAKKKESSENITIVYKGRWKHLQKKKVDIAIKVLTKEYKEKYLPEFLDLAGKWSILQSSVIVKMYGITLRNQLSLVMEYVGMGPLDEYLRVHRKDIESVDLLEASSNLASALFHLSENKIVHGNIRCKKILVAKHDSNNFTVKLADPGIHSTYSPNDVHWIPVEFYQTLSLSLETARRSESTDVWAFATTIYEIYTFGEPLAQVENPDSIKHSYMTGKRLPKTQSFPVEIYKILLECWDADPARRKQPQAILRDFTQMLYQGYNSRKQHSYARIKTPSENRNLESALSMNTETTDDFNSISDGASMCSMSDYNPTLPHGLGDGQNTLSTSYLFHADSINTLMSSLDSLSIQNILDLDNDYEVVLQGLIGQGFYGEVYQGELINSNNREGVPQKVAVKKLKKNFSASGLKDFKHEISIMKSLKHKNVVEIVTVKSIEDNLVMVMEHIPHGSLDCYLQINKDILTDAQILHFASDIAEGMDYLGKQNIVHRDLAARNILVVDENHVKISDFGLARSLSTENYYTVKTDRDLPLKWYALESIRDWRFSTRSDVWSYGVTLIEMYLRGGDPELPLDKDLEGPYSVKLVKALESGVRLPRPQLCPSKVYLDCIFPCWKAEPRDRPTFEQLYRELLPGNFC